ncbi:putative Ig domain-containing protein [Mesorhizobium sp. ANAO-SY3R2]|uniref:putative Ig domain-containing protein n=1 Tax=Mesorhizobium sp. ANAO-SY3R2 TaxID=3166644 RepID=UPI00366CA227
MTTVKVKLLTVTGAGVLEMEGAPEDEVEFRSRAIRPYRPADVKVNGDPAGTAIATTDPISCTWARRNRLTESVASPLCWTDPDQEPEVGQTTTIILYELDGVTEITRITGLTGTSYDLAWSAFGGNDAAILKFISERDGYESWTGYAIQVTLPNLAIAGSPVLTATLGAAYAGFTATASYGTPPYTYSLVGAWPAGISINASSGEVSGTPTASESFAGLSVRVTDAASNTADVPSFTLPVETNLGAVTSLGSYSRAHVAAAPYSITGAALGTATKRRLALLVEWTNRVTNMSLNSILVDGTGAKRLAAAVDGASLQNVELWLVDLSAANATSGDITFGWSSNNLNPDKGLSVRVFDVTTELPGAFYARWGWATFANVAAGVTLSIPAPSIVFGGYVHANGSTPMPATPVFASGDLKNDIAASATTTQASRSASRHITATGLLTVSMAASSGATSREMLGAFALGHMGASLSIALVTADTAHASATNTKADLELLGHTVTLITDSAIGSTDFASFDLIVAVRSTATSATSASATVAGQFRALVNGGKPLVVSSNCSGPISAGAGRSTVATLMNLTGTWTIRDSTTGTLSERQDSTITSTVHAITHGFFDVGLLPVYAAPNFRAKLTSGQPYVGTKLANGAGSDDTEARLIAIEAGTTDLASQTVAARVVLGDLPYSGQGKLTLAGATLLSRMCLWAAGKIG